MLKTLLGQYSGLSKSAYVFFFARLVTNMGAFIWPMLTLIFTEKMGYTATTTVTIFVAISVVFLPATILGGKLADKFDKKKIIIIFDLISVAFFFAAGIVGPSTLMVIFFIIAGLFATMEGPAFEALIAEATLPKEREKVFSLSYLGHNLGFIFGAAIGGLLFTNYLGLAFILDGITTLISTFLIISFVFVIKKEDINEEDKNVYEDSIDANASSIEILKSRKPIFVQILIFSLTAFIYDQWSFVLPLYMVHIFGDNGPVYFGIVSGFNGLVVILFTPILTYLLRKKYELPKMVLGVFLYSISYLILRDTEYLSVMFIFMFVFTIGEVVNMLGASPYISRRVPSSHRGRINAYRNIGYFIGSIGGKFASGILIDNYGYNSAITFLVVVGLVATVVTLYNYKIDKETFPLLYNQELNKT